MRPELVLYQDGERTEVVRFEAVPANSEREIIIEVSNEGDAAADDLQFEANHDDVEIVSSPSRLKPDEKAGLQMRYAPMTQLDKGISATLKAKATYLV